jgi:hypothetical protein
MCDYPLIDMTRLSQLYDINYIAPMDKPIQLELIRKYVCKSKPPIEDDNSPIDLNN